MYVLIRSLRVGIMFMLLLLSLMLMCEADLTRVLVPDTYSADQPPHFAPKGGWEAGDWWWKVGLVQ